MTGHAIHSEKKQLGNTITRTNHTAIRCTTLPYLSANNGGCDIVQIENYAKRKTVGNGLRPKKKEINTTSCEEEVAHSQRENNSRCSAAKPNNVRSCNTVDSQTIVVDTGSRAERLQFGVFVVLHGKFECILEESWGCTLSTGAREHPCHTFGESVFYVGGSQTRFGSSHEANGRCQTLRSFHGAENPSHSTAGNRRRALRPTVVDCKHDFQHVCPGNRLRLGTIFLMVRNKDEKEKEMVRRPHVKTSRSTPIVCRGDWTSREGPEGQRGCWRR